MNRIVIVLLLLCVGFSNAQSSWKKLDSENVAFRTEKIQRKTDPTKFSIYTLDVEKFKNELTAQAKGTSKIIQLPSFSGELSSYTVEESSNFTEPLHPKFGFIKSYTIHGINDKTEVGKVTVGTDGVHVTVFSGKHPTFYVDPYTKDYNTYISYNRADVEKAEDNFTCQLQETVAKKVGNNTTEASKNANDGFLRTYRLALNCTGEYAQFHITEQFLNGSSETQQRAGVLSAMNTTMARVNGIYERDLAVHMNIILENGDNPLIFLDSETDGFTNSSAGALINESQSKCDDIIGSANYDIGHVFSRPSNLSGVAYLASVCVNGIKGGGVTGTNFPKGDPYDIDFVAHELGHQFGAPHTFNNSCGGQRSDTSAVEPGSGSSIMAYAGICSPNVQNNSDDHFHAVSIASMWNHIQGTSCATITATGNAAPIANAGPDVFVPRGTPLILKGIATDVNGTGSLTYNWEQIDTEIATMPPTSGNTGGPLFRSFPSSTSPDRYLPKIETVAAGSTFSTWEVIPNTGREMNFSFTVRDNSPGGSATDRDDLKITVENINPFTVTSPNSNVTWLGETTQTITWNKSTTDQAPINCQNVRIRLSTDGGLTFPHVLIESTPNDGSQDVTIPNIPTETGRIMVEAVGNIFYNMNGVNFSIQDNPSASVEDFSFSNFNLYPNPSNGNIHVGFEVLSTDKVSLKLYDIRGRMVSERVYNNTNSTFSEDINYNGIQAGMYLLQIRNGDKQTTKKLLIK